MPLLTSTAPLTIALPRMSPAVIALTLSLLLGIQPISTDLYLPALPALTASFDAPMAHAQLTLSAMLLAFGISQLFWGPLSDRVGRRPVLMWGLALYTLASIGCALSASMTQLIGWRVMQGAAMGAVVMCARAIVRDLYQPSEGARIMSKGMSGLGVLACIAAPIGSVLSELYSWRAAMLAPAIFSACTLTLMVFYFRETIPRKTPHALQPSHLLGTWIKLFSNPTFVAYSALSTASYAGIFTILASSSFVYIDILGLSKTDYGLVMFSASFCYVAGTFLCRRLLLRYGVRKTVALAALLTLCAGTLMGVLALAGVRDMWAIALPQMLFMIAHGTHQPCGQSGAVGPFPEAAGAASAMNGFLMMIMAFAMGSWLGTRMDGTVLPLTNGLWLWCMLIAASAWTLVRRYGEPPAAVATQPYLAKQPV